MTAALRGRPCLPDEAVEGAAEILSSARFPLVFGLVDSTIEAQREAVRLARVLRGALDPASSVAQAGALAAFQHDGVLSASLGEMRRRADLIVFWGCDPERDHAGFLARFAPARPGRLRVAVDLDDSPGPADADERLSIVASREIAALVALRAFVRGRRLDETVAGPLGLPLESLRALARRLLGCAYGAFVVDGDPAPTRRDPARPHVLGRLVRDARPRARLRLVALRAPGNATGAENVLTWLTGFPAALSFASGSAQFGPGEFSAEALLRRGDADAALVVGADPARHLSGEALRHLASIPTVRLSPVDGPVAEAAAVFIATAPPEATAGHVFRMDGLVSAPRAGGPSALPEEAALLARIAARVEAQRGAA